ncbi:WD domain, G-beta repeat protein [Trichinella nativa]|uniref:WD domain, G-beta repeat protein n=1 Tax=Trichinella nativa TaxID=6335 RepID=A0A1Y3E458_9BILA|nr:WD domain, G-beta repeat protein [Trichinella nativa]
MTSKIHLDNPSQMGDDATVCTVIWDEQAPTHKVTVVCILPNRRHVISCGANGQTCVWQLDSNYTLHPRYMLLGHSSRIVCAAPASETNDCTHCVISDISGRLSLWDCENGRCLSVKRNDYCTLQIIPQNISWGGKTQDFLFCSGCYAEICALNPLTLETVFCLCSRVEPDWIAAFCFFRFHNKPDVIVGITNSGFVKIWSLTNSNPTNTTIFEDESKQLQCYRARKLIISPYNPRSLLIVNSTSWALYDASNFILLCSCPSLENQQWIGATFVQVDKLLAWSSNGIAYLYHLPRSRLKGKAVNAVIQDQPESKYLDDLFCCCSFAFNDDNQPKHSLNMDPAFCMVLKSSTDDEQFLIRGDCFGCLCIWLIPSIPDEAVITMREKSLPALALNPTTVSSLDKYWKSLPHKPCGMFPHETSSSNEDRIRQTCTLYMGNLMKLVFGQSDGSLVIASAPLLLKKHIFTSSMQGGPSAYRVLTGHDGSVTCLLYPYQENSRYDPTHFVSGGEDFTVILWDLKALCILHKFCVQAGPIQKLLVPPENCSNKVLQSVCSVAGDHSVALLNLKDVRCILLASKHLYPVKSIHWRPIDDFIMVHCEFGSVYVWQMETGHLDRVLTGALAEEMLVLNADQDCISEIGDESFPSTSVQLFRAFKQRNLNTIKEIMEQYQQSNAGQTTQTPTKVTFAPPLSITAVIGDEGNVISLLVVEHGILHREDSTSTEVDGLANVPRAFFVESAANSKANHHHQNGSKISNASEQGNFCVEIAQLLLSMIYSWNEDPEMDQLSKSKLGLLQPSRSVTFAFLSADGSMALLFPPPDDNISPIAADSLSSLLNTHQLMAITSITQTLLSMTYMSFIPEQINRRKLLKSNLDVEELNAAMQDLNTSWPCAESNGAMPTLIQQLLVEQAAIKQLWNRVRAFHSQVLPGKSARTNLDVEILCLRWQDRCQQLRQAAQTLLLAELDRIGAEGRARLVERWQVYLPIVVDPSISLFGTTLYSNQPGTAASSIGQKKLPYCSSSSTINNDHMKHRQEVATVLLGVIGAAFSHELLNCSTDQIVLLESNKRQISVPLITCQSLFECIVQPDSPSLPSNCTLRRSCIDLLGRGFAVWQPYLDISKLLLTLLALCAKSDRVLPAGPIYFPLSPAAEMCRTAQRALALIASCRPAAFVTALSKEVTRYTSMSQHQTVHLSSPLIRAQSEIMTIMESLTMNHYNELLDVMGAVEVADILVHCLSIQLLKFKNFSEFCPFLAKFSVISFSSNTRRIAFGLKSGSIIVHELRAGKAQTMQVHCRAVSACSFSDDGKHLASYSVEEGKLNVWLMAQSFLGMGQSQAKCIKQFAAPVNEISANGLDERFRILVTKSTAPMEQWIAQTLLMIVVLMAPAGALLLGCSRSRWMCFILLGVVSTVCFLCICVWISLFCDQQHPGDQPNLRQFLHNFTFGAHRGLADEAPENTLAAFEYSAKLGSTFVEFDLEMTADNTPVIMHDDTVDRTTNGTGFIGELDDDYVFSLNAAAKFKNGSGFVD